MRTTGWITTGFVLAGIACVGAAAWAQPVLTADQAVKMALEYNSQIINANAGIYTARGGVYRAYSGVLPALSASLTRSGTWTTNKPGTLSFGQASFQSPDKQETYSTSPSLGGSWSVLNLSSITGLSSARSNLRSAEWSRLSARATVAFTTRQQFYAVVQAVKQVGVNSNAAQLARDSERRVRALFEVGSVSRNDVLQAQVQTAQSQLDSIAAVQALLVQRDLLATLIGTQEAKMGEVDTMLTFTGHEYEEGSLLREAESNRPDLKSAAAALKSAKAAVASARFQHLPYLTVSGSFTYRPVSSSKNTFNPTTALDSLGQPVDVPGRIVSTRSESDRETAARVALNWDIFDGLAIEANNAQARANLMSAQDAYNVLQRNLAGQVHVATLTYQQALTTEALAEAAVASATESMKLTQQKYNVGSATILDLITAQVALQRAQSQLVGALAGIRVAEARIDQVRGRAE